jgi:protein-tyrosine phosphatase
MHFITDFLLVGNLEDAMRPPTSIHGLLFVAGEHEIRPPSGMAYARIPLKEFGAADPLDVMEAVDWLEQHGTSRRLLVCCRAGMGRSVSIVIAYLCCVKGMSFEEALDLARARRPGTTPLPFLEQTIQAVMRMRLARDNQIRSGPSDPPSDATRRPR